MKPTDPRRLAHRTVRQWRRFARRWRPPGAHLVFSPEYGQAVSNVPADPLRGELILAFLVYEGLVRPDQVHTPAAISVRALRTVHTDAYLESLGQPASLRRVLGLPVDARQHDRILHVQRLMAGGTRLALRLATGDGRPAIHLGGGLHHAHADRGQGFCVFNDVAVAIAELRRDGFAGNILVVDLDLHDGDGTRALFAHDASVYTFSLANRLWDEPDAVASTSLALGFEIGDAEYLAVVENELPPVIDTFRPELVVYLAGCDPAHDDDLGDWKISDDGMLRRDRFVVRSVERLAGRAPLVVVLGGGYGGGAWRYSARFFSWLLSGCAIEPPSTARMTLERYRHLRGLLEASGLLDSPTDVDDWGLSEADVMPGAAARPDRFLDFYSAHQIEVILERSGLFDRLRGLGFARPTLRIDLDNPAGHTLSILDSTHEEPLAELRARRDRRTLADFDMLRIEWLLLQNPRARFSPERPPLPGQRHPGLGMLRDAMALLMLVCERLHLAGILFVPSHFHLAGQARRTLAFADPHKQGRFEALVDALRSLPLAEGTKAVAEGRVIDQGTGEPYAWEPAEMVLPVSHELRARMRGEEYNRAVDEARERSTFRLIPSPVSDPAAPAGRSSAPARR